jgi:hypothetical protein
MENGYGPLCSFRFNFTYFSLITFYLSFYSFSNVLISFIHLLEICIFCNRDARCDNIFKAATVFERGRRLAAQLGIVPITKQIFVQVFT